MTSETRDLIAYNAVVFIRKLIKANREEEGMLSVILSYSITEAIFHDLTTFYQLAIDYKREKEEERNKQSSRLFRNAMPVESHFYNGLREQEEKFAKGFRQIERLEPKDKDFLRDIEIDRTTLGKFHSFFHVFQHEIKNPTLLSRLETLISIRHEVIHTKGRSYRTPIDSSARRNMVEGDLPDCLISLVDEGIIDLPTELASWLVVIDTESFCDWCFEVVIDVINEMIAATPENSMSEIFFLNFRELIDPKC
ncbi:hypothetical protein [Aeromonas veronii]